MTSFLRRLAAEHVGQTPVLHPLRASMYGERPGGGPDRVAEEPDPMEVAQDVEIDGSAPVSQVIGRPVDVDRTSPMGGRRATPSQLPRTSVPVPARDVGLDKAPVPAGDIGLDKAPVPAASPPHPAPISSDPPSNPVTGRGSLATRWPAGAGRLTAAVAEVSMRSDQTPVRAPAAVIPTTLQETPPPPPRAPFGSPAVGLGPRPRGYPPAPRLATSRSPVGPAGRTPSPSSLPTEERTIEVRIGRIEIRAGKPQPARVVQRPAARPQVSLSDYLRRREREAAG